MSIQLNLSTHSAELKAAYKEVIDKTCSTNWILLSYTKGSNELKVAGKGDGGLEELSEEFEDDKVLFALAQVTDPNSQLPKLVFISWCGEGAPVQRKGLLPSHLGHVQKFFDGYHVQINARDAEDVTPEQIMKKVDEGSGAKYSYHEQVRSQTPVSQASKPAVVQTPLTTSSYKKPLPPASKPEAPRAPSFKPPQASSNLQNRFLQQVDQGDKEKQAREDQERFEREFLQKSQPKPSQSHSGVSSRVQDARDREERELQERLEKARISRSGVSTGKHIPSRDMGAQGNNEAHQNAKRLEEERRREAEFEEQRKADKLQKERQRAEEEAQQKEREREQLRLEREREEKSRQEALELERLQRERESQEQEQRERKAREKEQKEREAQEQERREREAREKEQREREAQEQEQRERKAREKEQKELEARQKEQAEQDRKNEEAQREQERQASLTKEAEQSLPAIEGESNLTAIALFDYAAIDETEVNLKEGELVTGIQQIDEGWWQGTNESGQFGLFPANYVELVAPPEPSSFQEIPSAQTPEASNSQNYAVALYDYEASEQGELSFGAADRITNIDFLSDDWWQGTNPDGQTGLFPANYVELQ
ncbi:actin binding protein [Entomophthora muscae]|uniref:Actin binding protein n=1 Tax=Entomophthora muscae TaxID=34485 RepID=A0ACC2RYT4_9FUNG|nr:actin binding protein [Entomophthora muscae]